MLKIEELLMMNSAAHRSIAAELPLEELHELMQRLAAHAATRHETFVTQGYMNAEKDTRMVYRIMSTMTKEYYAKSVEAEKNLKKKK